MNVWRIVNSIALLLGFYSPWLRRTNSESPIPAWSIVILGIMDGRILSFILAIGAAAVFFYATLTIILRHQRRLHTVLLGLSVIGLAALWLLVELTGFLWGYWFTWVGVLSSIFIEVQDYRGRPPITEQDVAS